MLKRRGLSSSLSSTIFDGWVESMRQWSGYMTGFPEKDQDAIKKAKFAAQNDLKLRLLKKYFCSSRLF